MNSDRIKRLVELAIEEDIGTGDITTDHIIPIEKEAVAKLISKEEGIICGMELVETVCSGLIVEKNFKDGDKVKKGDEVLIIKGNARKILSKERIILNFMQRLSGVATTTNLYVQEVKDFKVKLLETRKTTPGFRELEKYAVKVGGGENHRMGLYDMFLIKDNHIKIAGSITNAVAKVKDKGFKIEVEVNNFEELKEVLRLDVDMIMLDNMSLLDMKKAVEIVNGRVKLEASGGITLKNIKEIASTGVDYISVGALTHSYKSLDLSINMEIK